MALMEHCASMTAALAQAAFHAGQMPFGAPKDLIRQADSDERPGCRPRGAPYRRDAAFHDIQKISRSQSAVRYSKLS